MELHEASPFDGADSGEEMVSGILCRVAARCKRKRAAMVVEELVRVVLKAF
jgi:hypothetical protein